MFKRTMPIALLCGVIGAGSTPVVSQPVSDETPATVTAASNAAQHAAEAVRYDQEADSLEKKAALHRQLAMSYSSMAGSRSSAGSVSMASHCRRLAASYAQAARDARSIAATHRALAK